MFQFRTMVFLNNWHLRRKYLFVMSGENTTEQESGAYVVLAFFLLLQIR